VYEVDSESNLDLRKRGGGRKGSKGSYKNKTRTRQELKDDPPTISLSLCVK